MSAVIRRATGTQNTVDVLLRALGIRRRNFAQDLEDYAAGVILKVTCFLRSPPDPAEHSQVGHLYLAADQPLMWRPVGKNDELLLQPPFTVKATGEKTGHWKLGAYRLEADGITFAIKIPKQDLKLLEFAMGIDDPPLSSG